MTRYRGAVLTALILVVAACTSAAPDSQDEGSSTVPSQTSQPTPLSADSSTSTSAVPKSTQAATPQPSCRSVETGPVENSSGPGDGVSDPAGRIAYAVVSRNDDAFGPIGTELYAIDPDGTDHVLLLHCDVIRPQWSPDGSRLAFTLGFDDGSWQIATISADGSDLQILTSGRGVSEIPSWSPDGSWIAYDGSDVSLDDPNFWVTLRQIAADGSGAALLGDPDTFDAEPRLSPDGNYVTFVRYDPEADWASEIVVRDLASGDERVVVSADISVEHPEWAPDGGALIFNATDFAPEAGTIYTLDLDDPDATPVVLLDPANGWGGVKPVYSPNGARIVFVCFNTGEREDDLCIMDATGANVTPLVDVPGVPENHPTWGPPSP